MRTEEILPWRLSGKEFSCQCKRHRRRGFDPWVRKTPWRRKWQLTPVFLPGNFMEQRSLTGYGPWGHKRLDASEHSWMPFCCGDRILVGNVDPWEDEEQDLEVLERLAFGTCQRWKGWRQRQKRGPGFPIPGWVHSIQSFLRRKPAGLLACSELLGLENFLFANRLRTWNASADCELWEYWSQTRSPGSDIQTI